MFLSQASSGHHKRKQIFPPLNPDSGNEELTEIPCDDQLVLLCSGVGRIISSG